MAAAAGLTQLQRVSPTEVAITRHFAAPPAAIWAAFANAALFARWWAPASMGARITACQIDARPGGGYRVEFDHPAMPDPLAFFGRYLEVVPGEKLVWSNEESPGGAITTMHLAAEGDGTRLTFSETHADADSLEAALPGMCEGAAEQHAQLDALLDALPAGAT